MLESRRLVRRATALSSLVATMLVASLMAVSPAEAGKVRPDFWGMHSPDWVSGPSVPVGAANLTITSTHWPALEVKNGKFYWGNLDAQVAAVEERGAKPMILLGPSTKFHSTRPRSPDYADFMPRKRAWKRYVAKVAGRFGDRLDYQVWPEPNIIQNWKGTPRQMARLTAWTSSVIRRIAPDATVVSPGVALRLDEQRAWTMRYFSQRIGGKSLHRYIDAIAIDPFPMQTGTPEDAFRIMKDVKRRLRRIGVREPIWVNEINYGVAGAFAPTRTRYRMNTQQAYVMRTYVLAAAAGMQRTYWLGWGHFDELGVHLVKKNGRPSAVARSYVQVRKWLNNTRSRGCRVSRGDVWTCTFRTAGEVRRVHWKVRGTALITSPSSTERVETQEGGVRHQDGRRRLTIDQRPVMVASRR